MAFCFQVFKHDENGGFAVTDPLCLELNDAGKAIKTFEMDVLACRMAVELISFRTDMRVEEIRLDDKFGSIDTSDFDSNLTHEVFDDCLGFCEYVLNRLTPHSDKAIKNLMVHCRFSLAHILRVTPSDCSHVKCSKGKSRNLAAFSHVRGESDEFRHISHIRYNSETLNDMGNARFSYIEVERALELEDVCSRYYRTILADMIGCGSSLLVQVPAKTYLSSNFLNVKGKPMMPLLRIISELMELHSSITPMRFHVSRDSIDMENNRVCEDEALLGRVRVRRPDMESSPLSIKESYQRNREFSGRVLIFARLLECVLSGSDVKRRTIQLSYRNESVLRLLDPDVFGKRYVTPMLIFADSEEHMRHYLNLIDKLGAALNATYTIESNAARMARCLWKYSDRQNVAVRNEGIMCNILLPRSSTIYDLLRPKYDRNDEGHHRNSTLFDKNLVTSPAILVSDREGCFRLASGLSDPSRREHARMVRMLVEVDGDFSNHSMVVTRNRDSNEIPQVTVSDSIELFNLHTEGVLPKARSAAMRIMDELDRDKMNTDCEKEVANLIRACCYSTLEDVNRAENILRGSRH